jgi:membrane-associated protein
VVESLRQLFDALNNVQGLVQWGGTFLVCAILFVETGLFVGFFLPGDSLLITAGIFAAAGHLKLEWLVVLGPLCAIAGDQLGYWIGRRAGAALYNRKDTRFVKRRYLEQAHDFYQKHGPATIILARFVPIVRTFCPPVAGAARMTYSRYLAFDIVGGVLWAGGVTLTGFFLGSLVPHIDKQIHWVIAAVIFLSILPPLIHFWKRRGKKPASALAPAHPEE